MREVTVLRRLPDSVDVSLMRLMPLLIFLAPLTLLSVGGVPLVTVILVMLAICTQTLGGAIWWTWITKRQCHLVELFGLGLSFGTLGSVVASQLFRQAEVHRWAWSLPTAATLLLIVLIPKLRSKTKSAFMGRIRLNSKDLSGLAIGFTLGLPTLAAFWLSHPLSWSGYRSYYVDIPYHEALSHSLHSFGPADSIVAIGSDIRYHWLSHAWSGALSDWTTAGPFIVMTRVLPLAALVGALSVGWSWARSVSHTWWVPALAGSLLVGGGWVGLAYWTIGDHLIPLSPSQSFSTMWLLSFLFLTGNALRNLLHLGWACFLLALLGFGLVGGKVSHAAVVAGAMLGIFLSQFVGHRKFDPRVVLLCVASGGGVLAGYVFFVMGADKNVLSVGFARTASGALGLEPWPFGVIGFVLGALALLLAIGARLAGIIFLDGKNFAARQENASVIGVVSVSVILLLFTTQSGASQLYFALSASAVLTVFSALGIGTAVTRLHAEVPKEKFDTEFQRATIFGVVAAIIGYSFALMGTKGQEISGIRELGQLRWLAPIAVVAVCFVPVAQRSPKPRRHFVRGPMARTIIVVSLISASFSSLAVNNLRQFAGAARSVDAGSDSGWHTDHLAAGDWLRQNSDLNDVVATNRLCSSVRDSAPGCSSRSFLVSATTGRRLLIEGTDYSVGLGALPDWALDRVNASAGFAASPNDVDYQFLRSSDVSWLWLDSLIPSPIDFKPYGNLAFENNHVRIIRFEDSLGKAKVND